jgi:hypothetical protein
LPPTRTRVAAVRAGTADLCEISVFRETASAARRRNLGVVMWVTPKGLSKLCVSRAACPHPFARRCGFSMGVGTTSFVKMAANAAMADLWPCSLWRWRLEWGGAEVELGLHIQVQEIAEQDWLLAVLASSSQPQGSAKMVALGATPLAEVAHIARAAFVNRVRDERGSPTESCPKELLLQVWQSRVAQTKSALAARVGAKASSSTAAWPWAEQATLWDGGRC